MIEPLYSIRDIVALTGGLSGLVTAWYYWKKFKRDIKIIPLTSWYITSSSKTYSQKEEKIPKIIGKKKRKISRCLINIETLVINNSGVEISITDVVCLTKVSKQFKKEDVYSKNVFVSKALNTKKFPIIISPYHSRKLKFIFQFQVDPYFLERMGIAWFIGWLKEKIPLFFAKSPEFNKEMWTLYPIIALLVFHINGRKLLKIKVASLPKREKRERGTIGIVELEKMKKDFWRNKV